MRDMGQIQPKIAVDRLVRPLCIRIGQAEIC
jgi:hypothetical protein